MRIGNINDHILYDNIKKVQVYKADRFHVLLLCLEEGALLKPHHSVTDAFFIVTGGEIIFTKGDDDFHLYKGDMFTFKAYEKHAVKALQNASLLLVK